jgi:L-ascorbate metabolism protein UlaG (beta-lactamase superfamily)
MDAAEAAGAVDRFGPKIAIPYHWGDIVGGRADAERFAALATCDVRILDPGGKTELG